MKLIVDIWQEGLDKKTETQHYWSFLNALEKNKANSMKSHLQKIRYIEVRAKLRWVLAHYINAQPQRIVFALEKHGKPYLPGNINCHFNLSHSGDQLVIAVAQDVPIGIDIEQWKNKPDFKALVKRCFAEEERDHWQALPEEQKQQEFYSFWTRKEALVKATGRGIGLGLDRCVISPEKTSSLLRIPDEYGPAEAWKIMDLEYPDGMSGALAAKSCGFEVKFKSIESITH